VIYGDLPDLFGGLLPPKVVVVVVGLVGTWTEHLNKRWVQQFVEGLGSLDAKELKNYTKDLERNFGKKPKGITKVKGEGAIKGDSAMKAAIIDMAVIAMSRTKCKDHRCDEKLSIISTNILLDEQDGGVQLIFRRGRSLKVNDPLAFNAILREIQRVHPTWPRPKKKPIHPIRGTKGISQIFDACGMGPLAVAHARNVVIKDCRGPASTDPNKKHPDGPRTDGKEDTRETDGLYYREFIFRDGRAEQNAYRLFD